MTKGERLKNVIENLNHNPNSFADEIGVSRPTIVDMIEERVMEYGKIREVSKKVIRLTKDRFPEVNEDYLKGLSDQWRVESGSEITNLKSEIANLKSEIASLKAKIAELKERNDELKEYKSISSQIKELMTEFRRSIRSGNMRLM